MYKIESTDAVLRRKMEGPVFGPVVLRGRLAGGRSAKTSSHSNAMAPERSPVSENESSGDSAGRRDHPQPPTQTPKRCTRQLLRLTARNQPSSQ
jgi:hypothetical protein